MYGLSHTSLLSNELFKKRLNQNGYHQRKLVPGLWTHDWRPITFTLVIDDFGVNYKDMKYAKHLKKVLEHHYQVIADWSVKQYISITLDWDYTCHQVHLSMPGYIAKALKQFQHLEPAQCQHSSFPCTLSSSPTKHLLHHLLTKWQKIIQQVYGKFLFLVHSIEPTLLCPISAMATQSANPIMDTLQHTR